MDLEGWIATRSNHPIILANLPLQNYVLWWIQAFFFFTLGSLVTLGVTSFALGFLWLFGLSQNWLLHLIWECVLFPSFSSHSFLDTLG